MSIGASLAGLVACFLLSGLAGLVYQTAWTREFAFLFGTSELAVAAVLAAYMGGLAAGAAVAGRLAARIRRPVLVYGALELGIGVAALAVPLGVRGATWIYVALFGGRADPPEAGGLLAALFYTASSFVILLLPTGFMGATLPLLARHAVRRDREIGARVGLLYAVNTLGAVLGTVLAGFVLLPWVGLRLTVWVAVGVNLLVAVLAAAIARGAPPPPSPAPGPAAGRGRIEAILPLIALSGFVSFAYEVLWTRLLGHVLGASVYAFATMLATFLAGIALGSAVASRFARDRRSAAIGFGVCQLGTALLALGAFAGLDAIPDLAGAMASGGSDRLLVDAAVSALVLLPSTLCIGGTFPMAVRLLARDESDAAAASARVYSWNTVGAIAGALAAGFAIIPALGFVGTVVAGALANAGLALAAAFLVRPNLRRLAVAGVAGLLAVLLLRPAPPWNVLRSTSSLQRHDGDVVYFGVGRSATVMVQEYLGRWELRTNGLSEASILPPGFVLGAFQTSQWLSSLPALARPEARSMLVVGLGGGLLLEYVPPTIEDLEVVELEPLVIEANRVVAPKRGRDPLADPRLRLRVNDARGALLLTGRRFDAIVSQPSHPWTAGASPLYTREFFSLARSRLADDGVFVQWIGPGFVDAALLRTILATLCDVFEQVELYQPHGGLLFLASAEALVDEASVAKAIASAPDHFARLGVLVPEDALAARLLDDAGARRFSEGARLNTDDWNRLQLEAPRLLRREAPGVDAPRLLAEHDPLPLGLARSERGLYGVRWLLARGHTERARRVGRALPDATQRRVADALVELEKEGRRRPALRALRAILDAEPDATEARAPLLLQRWSGTAATDGLAPPPRGLPDPAEAAVGAAAEAARDERWSAVREGEAALAAVPPDHPLHAEAQRLRAAWRTASGDPALAAEALGILDPVTVRTATPATFFSRAEAAAVAGRPEALLSSLEALLQGRFRDLESRRRWAYRARRLLDDVPVPDELAAWESVLRAVAEAGSRPG